MRGTHNFHAMPWRRFGSVFGLSVVRQWTSQCSIIPSKVQYQFTDPGGVRGFVGLGGESELEASELGARDSQHLLQLRSTRPYC